VPVILLFSFSAATRLCYFEIQFIPVSAPNGVTKVVLCIQIVFGTDDRRTAIDESLIGSQEREVFPLVMFFSQSFSGFEGKNLKSRYRRRSDCDDMK